MIQQLPTAEVRRYRTQRDAGLCTIKGCRAQAALNPATGRRYPYCAEHRQSRLDAGRRAVATYQGTHRARGQCVFCPATVTKVNPKTGLPHLRCTSCARKFAAKNRSRRESRQRAALGMAS